MAGGPPVLIWGAGAIGGVLGAYWARAGLPVLLVDIVTEHVEACRTTPATGAATAIACPGGTTTSPPTRRTALTAPSVTMAVSSPSRARASALRYTTESSPSAIG